VGDPAPGGLTLAAATEAGPVGHDTGPGAARPPWTALGPADAPAIVFVHGTRLTRAQWWSQVRRLSPRYRCVAVDLPGHGARAGEPFTLEAAAQAVAEAVEAAVPTRRAVVVGLSLGGYVAIETAERFPDRVAGLVLAGCSGEPAGASGRPIRLLAALLERTPPDLLDKLNRGFFRLRYPARIADPIVAGGFWPAGGAQALRALVGARFLDRLGRLWTPVLVVNGALDPVFGPSGPSWAAACRRGRHVVIQRAMHLAPLDRPRAFSDVVGIFVDEVNRPP
jgi:pimeloyl-ACP methyl ester carboxylesterase